MDANQRGPENEGPKLQKDSVATQQKVQTGGRQKMRKRISRKGPDKLEGERASMKAFLDKGRVQECSGDLKEAKKPKEMAEIDPELALGSRDPT